MSLKFTLAIALVFFPVVSSSAQQRQLQENEHIVPYDAEWVVTGYYGDTDFLDEESYIGKTQYFYGGTSEGPFFSCEGGLSKYMVIKESQEALFMDPYLWLLSDERQNLNIKGNKFWISRLACRPDGTAFFPFIQSNFEEGFIILGSTLFILEVN